MLQHWLLWALIGYLCGSIPFAVLLAKWHGVDLSQVGSGNPGATNLGRALGRKWGLLCFGLDAAKGLLPVLAAGWAMGNAGRLDLSAIESLQWLSVAVAAVLGHVFPVWLRFKGGKGVATGFGVLMGIWPALTVPGFGALLTWLIVVGIWRMISLASVVAALSLPIWLLIGALWFDRLTESLPFLIVAALLAVLVVVRHRTNLARIRAGTESKLGQNAKEIPADRAREAAQQPEG